MTNKISINKKYSHLINNDYNSRYLILSGGRGSGKSYAASLALVMLLTKPNYRILYTRYTLVSASVSIIPEFLEKIELLGLSNIFNTTQNSVKNKLNGSEILFKGIRSGSGHQTANLKSLQGINIWVLDEAEELVDEKIFDTIDYSIRDKRNKNRIILIHNPSHKNHWIYNRFFKDIPEQFSGEKNNCTYIHTSYLDNLRNLSEDYINIANKLKLTNLKAYNHIWMGHWAEESEHSLFKFNTINTHRLALHANLPDFTRIVVAIDPAVTSKTKSDETGIITVGKSLDGHYYVLSDISGKYTPSEWATLAIAEYKNKKADKIIAEVNQGGDLVEQNIKNVNREIPYDSVRATRGKVVRAEPVAALYEQGLVHHIGTHVQLESQMISFDGSDNNNDDRFDALIWAITYLSDNSIGEFKIETLTKAKDKVSWVDVY